MSVKKLSTVLCLTVLVAVALATSASGATVDGKKMELIVLTGGGINSSVDAACASVEAGLKQDYFIVSFECSPTPYDPPENDDPCGTLEITLPELPDFFHDNIQLGPGGWESTETVLSTESGGVSGSVGGTSFWVRHPVATLCKVKWTMTGFKKYLISNGF